MALIIVTGGTTGAADGTAVSQGGAGTHPVVISALNTPVDAHIRCDPLYYSADQTVTVPAGVEISFDGGSTWFDDGDNPIDVVTGLGFAGTDLEDVNYPVKLRQTATAGSTIGSFATDGSYSAITVLADVTGLLGSRSSAGTQVDLTWTAVANRTYYKIERATAADFTTGLTTLSSTATATTYADTGRTAGTTYYYRVKALGTGRYADSAGYATLAAYPSGVTSFTTSAAEVINAVEGPDGNIWATMRASNKIARITPTGTVDEFACTGGGTLPVGICVLGGNIWVACSTSLIKISTFSGTPTQTSYAITAGYGICAGPDGNLWVTGTGVDVRKVNPATGGTTATYSVASGSLRYIATDGTDLFITNISYSTTGAIVRCTTGGTLTTTACPDASSDPFGICWDATSGFLYVAAQGTGKLLKVTNGGTQTFTGYTLNASAQPGGVCIGPDGRVYTSGYNSSYKNVYSMPAGGGSFTTEAALPSGTGSFGLCKHSNDSVWVCNYLSNASISRFAR